MLYKNVARKFQSLIFLRVRMLA